jgi:membrane associated rhomboid family serine protease
MLSATCGCNFSVLKEETHKILFSFWPPLAIVTVMWVIRLFETLSGINLGFLGIVPHSLAGLRGILFAPFLHGDYMHLLSNTWPVLFLGAGIVYYYPKLALRVTLLIWFFTGLWVWILARPSTHIGASGVVYGMAFFLFFSGVLRRDLRALGLALIVAFLYGGMVWGLYTVDPGISWESHLFGALIGVISAWHYRKVGLPPPEPTIFPESEEAGGLDLWDYKKHFPPPEEMQDQETL